MFPGTIRFLFHFTFPDVRSSDFGSSFAFPFALVSDKFAPAHVNAHAQIVIVLIDYAA